MLRLGLAMPDREELEKRFGQLVNTAPTVTCPNCLVPMSLRILVPVMRSKFYRATYRCPQCAADTLREFTCST